MKFDVEIIHRNAGLFLELADDMPSIANFIVSQVADDYADWVRDRYLSGQVLRKVTGETYSSTKFFKMQEGTFGVRPGVGVPGSLNYLYRWVGTGREFMKPSARAFRAAGMPQKTADRILSGILSRQAALGSVQRLAP